MKAYNSLEEKVFDYMEQYRMLQSGDRVVAGVSGGADSVCLLFLLKAYQKKIPFELAVVHVDHGIRSEAQQDAAYVGELCKNLGYPFYLEKADVPGVAGKEGLSEEEAGRKVRYEAFEKYARLWCAGDQSPGAVKLALAHHMGDRAETLLFHLFRGTGIRGLASIQPVRDHSYGGMTVIRPLLCLERSQIEAYLKAAGIRYCQDSTNGEDEHARNRIRHHILPYAEQEICSGALRHINRTARELSLAEEYLELQTRQAGKRCVTLEGTGQSAGQGMTPESLGRAYCIHVPRFLEEHELIRGRLLLGLLKELSPCRRDMGSVHVSAVMGLFRAETGKEIHLPMGIRARRVYDRVLLERAVPLQAGEILQAGELFLTPDRIREGTCQLSLGGKGFTFRLVKVENPQGFPENQYTKWFDYAKIKGTLSIRCRRRGDYLTLRGSDGRSIHKTVKDYMITEKIPRDQRDRLLLLAEGSHVLWIPGYRISEAYKVDSDTLCVLQVEYEEAGAE